MSTWDAAPPPDVPPLRPVERMRLVLRGIWAALTLAVMFALFFVAKAVDAFLATIWLAPVTRLGPRVVQLWAVLALPTLGLRFVQNGRPMRRAGTYVANHSSWIDVVALQRAAAPFLVSKSEVRSWPGIGFIGRSIGTMFIDRNPAAAKRQEAELRVRLARGDHMALFPEGTSSDGRRVLPFKSALFAVFFAPDLGGRIAVQPVSIRYRPPAGQPDSFYAWWGDMDFAAHLLGLLARSVGGKVELTFHEPIPVAEAADRKTLARMAEACVREGFER